MGRRRLALVVMTACSAKPAATTAPAPAPSSVTAAPTSAAPATTPTAVSPQPAAPAAPASNATLAEVGLAVSSLDRSVDPCVDFYQFACGGWLASNPIPNDRARWSRVGEVDDKNTAALRAILEGATGKLGDYYASCMDEAAIEKAGIAPLQPLLAKTLGVKDAKSWATAVGELHRHGVWVGFAATVKPDLKSSTTNVTVLDAGGLGLPDRDYYVRTELKDKLDGYQQHVARMLALAGVAKPEVAAGDAVAIETELAKLTKSKAERRDMQASFNAMTVAQLAKRTKSLDWNAYFKRFGVAPSKQILVGAPRLFAGLDGLRKRFKPAQWSGYFTYHLVRHMALALPKAFADEAFALEQLVRGVADKQVRSKQCIASTGIALDELLGRAYVEKHFSPDAKQAATAMFDALVAVMSDELGRVEWMSATTRQAAQAKLGKLVRMIGFPERWRTYDFDVKRDNFAGNVLRAGAFETRRVLAKAGKSVDRAEWPLSTFDVATSYDVMSNAATLPAGMLQTPFFGVKRSAAVNYGAIGTYLAHELTHGFDDIGAQFDGDGKLADWWHADDKAKLDAKSQCVAAQYDTFEALPKQFVDGKLTSRENIADLGGVKLAFKAYRSVRRDPAQVADGFTEDQQFFLGFGQAWCSKERPAETQRRLATDPHSPPKFRVFGALRNLPEFSQAFQCAAGTPMHPDKTCSVW